WWDPATTGQKGLATVVGHVATCARWISPRWTQQREGGFEGGSVVAPAPVVAPGGAPVQGQGQHPGAGAMSPSGIPGGLDASMDPHCFLTGSEDPAAAVRLWDARLMQPVHSFPSLTG